jgi:hypothetical protein
MLREPPQHVFDMWPQAQNLGACALVRHIAHAKGIPPRQRRLDPISNRIAAAHKRPGLRNRPFRTFDERLL